MSKNNLSPRDVLTPDALAMLQRIEEAGSFAAAARAAGMVPSALTYRVRQIEDALDVLLFDRSARHARLTPAGRELLREGARLLDELDAVANRVKRVATGWEAQLPLAVDGVINRTTLFKLCEAFLALEPPTRLRLRDEVLSGTLEALTSGQADLAIGVVAETLLPEGVDALPLGSQRFIFAVAPHHPLARATAPPGRRHHRPPPRSGRRRLRLPGQGPDHRPAGRPGCLHRSRPHREAGGTITGHGGGLPARMPGTPLPRRRPAGRPPGRP